MELQLPKGTKDSLPEVMIRKQRLITELRRIFELYGYSPLDTPVIERYDVLSAKYAGGSEILKETFKLKDQGKRQLALRYDLTVPFARVVGMNPQIKMPFKRYQIDKVWRDGPIGLGRYREFWQCDVDIVGTKQMTAEAELLSLVKTAFEAFKLDYEISINNRKLLNGILETLGVTEGKEEIILVIDKIKKTTKPEIEKELREKGMSKQQIEEIEKIFSIRGDNSEKLEKLKKKITSGEGLEGIKELEELFSYLDSYGVKNYVLELSLTRGLAFYTGTVFETFLKENRITSAVASGGRYDKIIGKFLESKLEYPAVGISFGLDRISDALESEKDLGIKTVTKVFVIPIQVEKEAIKLSQKLRKSGINTEIDLLKRGISKNLDYANSLGIQYVIFVGENELKAGKFKLKNMKSGEESMLDIEGIISKLK